MKYVLMAAALVLGGCTNIDAVTTDAQMAVAMAAEAKELALEASKNAAQARETAEKANSTANDAVEAVSRMAEKCCRK